MGSKSLLQRLWNWSAWARVDDCRPDASCANPIYSEWIPSKHWDAGWGDPNPTEMPVRDVDEDDAEVMDAWVRQLARPYRSSICRRFVLRIHVHMRELEDALDALEWLMAQNRIAVREIRRAGGG